MKWRIGLWTILAAIGIALGASMAHAQTGVINDGGFESGNLSQWLAQSAVVATESAHTGNYGVRLNGASARVSQNIASRLTAGVNQTFVAYVQVTTRGTSWGSVWFRLDQYADCGAGSYGTAQAVNDTATGWQMLTLQRTFTASQLASPVYLCVVGFGFTNGVANVDDIGIGGSPVTPTNTATRTSTNTPQPPTATRTATNTPLPPTITNTPIPPTLTSTPTIAPPTNTPTATNTAQPPTPTNTATRTPTLAPPTSTNTPTLTPTATATPIGTVTPTPIFEVDVFNSPRAGELPSTLLTLSIPVPMAIQQCTAFGSATCTTYATHHYLIVAEPDMWYKYVSPSGAVLEFYIPPGTQYWYQVLPQ